ncbi:hypothetical protein [Paractinoplanes durhamensis]|uniref:Uncharacterized protein n=1 Tax=Paractinoplanes durhamensis TaxID=113563 RepID=A0ABQ3Z0P2_9ACTN|nr:hypothetical protein [Actinoplanes durhamensis]GIE03392.1 hypothetical protein Adu01nite_47420 [Actinoplanes durhamensis]
MSARHWHGYFWTGASAELKDDSTRRPGAAGSPERQPFVRSTVPPLQTGYYLLRSPEAGHTWTDPDETIAWLAATYQRHPPHDRDSQAPAYVGLDQRKVTSRDGLVNGVDACWQYYTAGMGQVVLVAICCPHSHLPDLDCPMPPHP